MIGKTISHYRILEKLGEGGMGVVYKAEDTKLKRAVALKFLPPHALGNDEERTRFVHEAQAAAALDHINICTIYEIDEADGQTFIAMAYVPGQSLKEKIESGPMELKEALDIAIQIADGLQEAHAKEIVHRDIKPANVMVNEKGQAKIMDFGLAKLSGRTKLTKTSTTLGTVAYMSPEQGRGQKVDYRSDIWSFGVILYEMFTGQMPFPGDYEQAVMYATMNEDPQPPKELNDEISEELQEIILKTLEKEPQDRFQSTSELLQSLKKLRGEKTGPVVKVLDLKSFITLLRRPRNALVTGAILLLVASAIFFPYRNLLRVQQFKEQLLKIENLARAGSYFEAYQLAIEAEKVLDNDSTLARWLPTISDRLTVITQPEGAQVYLQRFDPDEQGNFPEREYVGETPIDDLRIGRADYKAWIEKEGFAPLERMVSSDLNRAEGRLGIAADIKIEETLLSSEMARENMVRVASGAYKPVGYGLAGMETVELEEFFIDKYEVSNEQFRAFIRAGGYANRWSYWKYSFVKDSIELTFEAAMQLFKDKSSMPGPRDWINQEYPDGKGKHPVTGITWYEAAAYAEYAGKVLPTIYQWEKAARAGKFTHFECFFMPWGLMSADMSSGRRANYYGRETAPVDSYPFGISPYGAYNMAGNVAEWCLNKRGAGYATPGGNWADAPYIFASAAARPAFEASNTTGFRCVSQTTSNSGDQGAGRIEPGLSTLSLTPVDDTTYQGFLSHYRYDKSAIVAEIIERVDTPDWTREKLTFEGIGGDRVVAYLYLPKGAQAPYQCINYVVSSTVFFARTAAEEVEAILASQIKAGRAVMAVVPRGALEREWPGHRNYPSRDRVQTVETRDVVILRITEFRKGLDYLETRDEIDMGRIAHIGLSWGAKFAAIVLNAVEPRIRSSLFIGGGLGQRFPLPEVNPVNFAPRIKKPALVLTGKYDETTPYQPFARLLFELLPGPKRLELVESGHLPPLEIRNPIINSWLDETLGPVKFK
ncbi:protein kinase [candidate division KSB1 bacterium]|nr:protein kinase [candidate division KSB1 bacterium]